ncbi:hypothetical protein B0O80DRAFT_444145 [Mortierella sp. GBAus27b]|nr:hypothetical protein B0O80DRAFT_444145 [Mortierella sp. GBAus27b]
MSKGSKEAHEVHMTYHAGYDLKRPKAFFDKYGSYILTMMYMVKYGAMAAGYVVPPLLQSKRAGMIEQGQEQDRVAKEDIERLINDTITYLKEMNHDTDSDTNNQGWNVVHADLSDVKSYLEVNEGDPFPGGIHQLTRLEQRCSWVCEEHQYEWNLKYLRDVVNAMGGTYIEKPGNIDIKVNLGSVPKPFYDVIIEFCTIQCAKDRQLLTIDCGRLSLTTDGTQDVVMNIKRLSDLTTDDIDFIRQCSPNKLSIEYTPMKADENRLINILHQTLNLEELRIGCLAERSRAVINFIVSTRELAIQEGKLAALHTFELMEEELRPVKYDRMWDGLDHISATLTFSEDSAKVDVDTRVVMQTSKDLTEQDWICSFIRQYGWSISRLETATRFNDHLAALLDDSTQIHGSKLTALVLSQYSLTAIGMDAMDRVVKRSRGLTYFKAILARLQKPFQPEKVAPFLERFGARLNKLQLIGNIVERWLPAVRGNLPLLDELAVGCYTKHPFPHACLSWLVSMVSAPPRSSDSSVRLKILNLSNLNLIPQDWEALIKAVDYSVMLELKFNETNFARKQLDLMLESITSTGEESVPLEYLDIWNTDLVRNADKDALHERIQKVVPRVKILSL